MIDEQTDIEKGRWPRPTLEPLQIAVAILGAVAFIFLLIWLAGSPPKEFPTNTAITIERGLSASAVADRLEATGVVKSDTLLYFIITLWHDPISVKAGTYVFSSPLTAWQLAGRLTEDAPPDSLIALTFPEGFNVRDYSAIASEALSNFDQAKFLDLAESSEGYLFPDTYYVPPDYTAEELFALLKSTYEEKFEPIASQVESSGISEKDLVTLASVVEREANTPDSMSLVAGILRNRLDIGMALQADATIEYVLDKPLSELTPEDLEIDSPYNTYLYPGLPPTPIGNPGLQSIDAVLNPTTTDYFYYITDADGVFHYAKTFEEHRRNIERHLR